MDNVLNQLPLKSTTSQEWVEMVLKRFDEFLVDHASCERKACAQAMSFVSRFSDREKLIEPMICLAREELAHFHEVYKIMAQRGLEIAQDEKDAYVKALQSLVRHGREEYFLDKLLVSATIEARSCERFYLVGKALGDENPLGSYYLSLGRKEAGHYKIFVNIAYHYFDEKTVQNRLDYILEQEAKAIATLPLLPKVH
jgi:tRNA-(ms[2]io[6]A)-hydroxylase